MPITLFFEGQIIHTILTGRVTDDELLSYYTQPVFRQYQGLWRELVDGRRLTEMAVTSGGQLKLEEFVTQASERLRGGRVAMLASSEVSYGLFRQWELQREHLGYAVSVFRDFAAARAWLESPTDRL